MKFSVFGRKMEIRQTDRKWEVYLLGTDGKKRKANDIVIPSTVTQDQLTGYLDDLLHEWATQKNDKVYPLK